MTHTGLEPAAFGLEAQRTTYCANEPCPLTRGPVAEWTRRLTTNQEIAGSTPARINPFKTAYAPCAGILSDGGGVPPGRRSERSEWMHAQVATVRQYPR